MDRAAFPVPAHLHFVERLQDRRLGQAAFAAFAFDLCRDIEPLLDVPGMKMGRDGLPDLAGLCEGVRDFSAADALQYQAPLAAVAAPESSHPFDDPPRFGPHAVGYVHQHAVDVAIAVAVPGQVKSMAMAITFGHVVAGEDARDAVFAAYVLGPAHDRHAQMKLAVVASATSMWAVA